MNQVPATLHLETAVVVALFVLCFATYHRDLLTAFFFLPFSGKVSEERQQAYTMFLRRFSGVILFGVIPLTCLFLIFNRSPAEYGLHLPTDPIWFLIAVAVCLLVLPVLILVTRRPVFRKSVPYARLRTWRRTDRIWNAISWGCYLAAYEAGLRGYLLFSLMRSIGEWPAILVMTAIYVIIHVNKRWEEALGGALMGPVLGYLALTTGSILIPWLIHVFIANTVDALAVRYRNQVVSEV
jgi:membrane protease YdiL (CAAX protease family)